MNHLDYVPDRPLDPLEPQRGCDDTPRCDHCGFEADQRWPYIVPVARNSWRKGIRIMICEECKSRLVDSEAEDAA